MGPGLPGNLGRGLAIACGAVGRARNVTVDTPVPLFNECRYYHPTL